MTNSELDTASGLIATAFAEAERRGWRGLTIPMLAKKAGLTVAEAYKVAPDMSSLLDVYAELVDAGVAEEFAGGETGEAVDAEWRERLFDACMLRFDAMLKDREALRVIAIEERRSVIGLPRAALRAQRSMLRMLEAAGLAEDPLVARGAAIALVPLYARVFQVWLKDEPDQAKTMAALDKALRRIERWLERMRSAGWHFRRTEENAPDATPADAPAAGETKH